MRHIVYTCPDGAVAICHPAAEFVDGWLSHGGYWRDKPRGWVDAWIERRTAEGRSEWGVTQFARRVQAGGSSTAEALAAIRDFDCAHLGSAFELTSPDGLPDRWFRDAWRRSHNGGPITLDIEAAREVQRGHITAAVRRENHRRRSYNLFVRKRPLRIAIGPLRDRIERATDAAELRRVWPEELTVSTVGQTA